MFRYLKQRMAEKNRAAGRTPPDRTIFFGKAMGGRLAGRVGGHDPRRSPRVVTGRLLFPVLLTLAVILFSTLAAATEQVVLVAADVASPESPMGRTMDYFARLVEIETNGLVVVKVHHLGELGSEWDLMEKIVKNEQVHFVAPGGDLLTNWHAAAGIMNFPYVFKSRAHANRVWSLILDDFSSEMAASAGLQGLAVWSRPVRNLSANRAVRSVADMQGLRIMTPASEIWRETFRRFKAVPKPLPYFRAYRALESGAVDGQDNAIDLSYASGFFDFNKYFILTRHIFQDAMLIVNAKWFAGLPDDIQDAIRRAARLSAEYCTKETPYQEARMLALVGEKLGVYIIEPEPEGFRTAVEGMITKFPHLRSWYERIESID